jgi:hypothetical protein
MATCKRTAARPRASSSKKERLSEALDPHGLARIVLVRIPEHLSGQERGLPNGCTFGCGRLFFASACAIEPAPPPKAHPVVNRITFPAARLARLVL